MAIVHYSTRYPFDETTTHECDSVMQFCVDNIGNAQPFRVSDMCGNDITRDFDALKNAREAFVCITPAGAETLFALVISLAISAATVLLMPKPELSQNVNRNQESPNNALADRDNKMRYGQRLPTIIGAPRAIPDVIAPAYRYFEDNDEIEIGNYIVADDFVSLSDIRDGTTPLANIAGSTLAAWHPEKQAGIDSPFIDIGSHVFEPVPIINQSNEVKRILLQPKTQASFTLNPYDVTTTDGGSTVRITSAAQKFTEVIDAGATARLDGFSLRFQLDPPPAPEVIIDKSGSFLIVDVHETYFVIDTSSDPDFAYLVTQSRAIDLEVAIRSDDIRFTDWITFDRFNADYFYVNVVAENGMFRDAGGNRTSRAVTFRVEYQQVIGGTPTGAIFPVDATVSGSDSNQKGETVTIYLPSQSGYRVRLARVTDRDLNFNGTVVDEIRWRDLYSARNSNQNVFGYSTFIQTRRRRDSAASAVQNPQLNMIATEQAFKYLGNGVFDSVRTDNTDAMQSLIHLAMRNDVGRMSADNIKLDALLTISSEITNHFGDATANDIGYTLDTTKMTAQEVFYLVCNAVNCVPVRRGRTLSAIFIKPQTYPSRVFTRRSKKPDAETWTRAHYDETEFDSVSISWKNQDGVERVLTIPETSPQLKVKKLEIAGIVNYKNAYWRAWREYQRIKHERVSVEFEAAADGALVTPLNMIAVTKSSRVGEYDGEVLAVNGLTLTLSQRVKFTAGETHSIILKTRKGEAEVISCTGVDSNKVTLNYAPAEPIYTGRDALRTEFSFAADNRRSAHYVVPQTIDQQDGKYVKIRAVNYAAEVFAHDSDSPIDPEV